MASLSVKLPLTLSSIDGFTMNKSFPSLIRQNLKAICLTNPGERVMEPQFGAGIQTFLFAGFSEGVPAQINSAIREQVKTYLPIINIEDLIITEAPEYNRLEIQIRYSIPTLNVKDLLQFTI